MNNQERPTRAGFDQTLYTCPNKAVLTDSKGIVLYSDLEYCPVGEKVDRKALKAFGYKKKTEKDTYRICKI